MSFSRVRSTSAALAALGTLALLAGCGGSTSEKPPAHAAKPAAPASASASLAALPPAQILSKALAAAGAAGSVHFTVAGKSGSTGSTDDQNASSDEGTQASSYTNGASATFRLVDGVGYMRANAAALSQFFPGKLVSQFAGRWIAARPGDPGYADITDGMTLGSALTEFTPTGTLTSTGPRTVDGKAVIGVKGVAAANTGVPQGLPAILYVMAAGQPLPVSYQAGAGADQEATTFSRWGETVRTVAPANPVPITSVMSS